MKKKILFVLPTFEIGGTVVSTKNLILLLDKTKYDISVLCMTGKGTMKYMFDDIKRINTSMILYSLAIDSWKYEKNIFKKIISAFIRFVSKNELFYKILIKRDINIINQKGFDAIISCQERTATYFVSHTNVKNKIAWVRCDFEEYIKKHNKDYEHKIYSKFKSIVCVSDITSKKFKNIFPQLNDKVYGINNPQSEEYIIRQSDICDNDSRFVKNGITIVSVGRIDSIKRFTEIPKIASFLLANNIQFKWYIIGDGHLSEKERLNENIIKEKVEDVVICLGSKNNPHYYIKNSDLLVSLSSTEACPRVINEAKILNIPIICTDFDTAKEYINNMENGIISSLDRIGYRILEIIQNKTLYETIKENLCEYHFDNHNIMKEINSLINLENI